MLLTMSAIVAVSVAVARSCTSVNTPTPADSTTASAMRDRILVRTPRSLNQAIPGRRAPRSDGAAAPTVVDDMVSPPSEAPMTSTDVRSTVRVTS